MDPIFNDRLNALLHDYCVTERKGPIVAQIVEHVLPYVKRLAHGLARRSTDPVEDLVQVGSIGLIKAIEKYNPLAGTSFKTYATYLITGEIRHYLRDKSSMIKAPRQMYELYYRMNSIIQRLTETLGRMPTDLEIADELQCPVAQVQQVQDAERRRQPVSLDQFAISGEGEQETSYLERLVDDRYFEVLQTQENRLLLEKVLKRLKPELRIVVTLSYFEDQSQMEIAQKLGISQMQVSRRLRKALDLLHTWIQEEKDELAFSSSGQDAIVAGGRPLVKRRRRRPLGQPPAEAAPLATPPVLALR
jgi:RNA polymerase sigma-B factor